MTAPTQQEINDFCSAAEHNQLAAVAAYVAKYPGHLDVRSGADRWTALTNAALRGHLQIVSLLVDAGANLTVTNPENKTAHDIAQKNGHTAVAGFLFDRATRDKIIFYDQLGDLTLQEVYDFASLRRFTFIRPSPAAPPATTTIDAFENLTSPGDESRLRQAFNAHLKRGGTTAEELVFPHRLAGKPRLVP